MDSCCRWLLRETPSPLPPPHLTWSREDAICSKNSDHNPGEKLGR